MTVTDAARAWLPLGAESESSKPALFCFPHAGGAASAFRSWLGTVPGVEVLPVQPPGREARARERPYEELHELVDQFAALIEQVAVDRPYALYGHSLGALVAFETAREMRRSGEHMPTQLIVSGAPAPHASHSRRKQVSTMRTNKLIDMMRGLGGTPEWVLSDPELVNMVLPTVRADFAMRESYRYYREPPLDVPLTVIASNKDRDVSAHQQEQWKSHTSSTFTLHTLRGGHFAIFEQAESMQRYLGEALRGDNGT